MNLQVFTGFICAEQIRGGSEERGTVPALPLPFRVWDIRIVQKTQHWCSMSLEKCMGSGQGRVEEDSGSYMEPGRGEAMLKGQKLFFFRSRIQFCK